MLIRRAIITAAAVLLAGTTLPPKVATGAVAAEVESPPGQVTVVTANARQLAVLDTRHFNRLLALTLALRSRPPAFNGGRRKAVSAPDVIVVQEITLSNLEILAKLLRQRSDYRYEMLAGEGSSAKFLVNTDTVTVPGEVVTWTDPCVPDEPGKPGRRYQYVHMVEAATGAPFTVAGVHYHKNYAFTPETKCKERNTAELRSQLEEIPGPVIVGGDFNLRSMELRRECDANEESPPMEWWSLMAAPTDGGRVYVDAVREARRRSGGSMVGEWTHEQDRTSSDCRGAVTNRRSRIDYIFSSGAVIGEAGADHPGWAAETPGMTDPENHRYSDHRFVVGRFVLTGPPRPGLPSLEGQTGGNMQVTWEPVADATGYVVYRAKGNGRFAEFDYVDGALTTYDDGRTNHGVSYRYAVAAVGADAGQGRESRPVRAKADARGPQVVSVRPARGARGVGRRSRIDVWFDEPVDRLSVTGATINLSRNGKNVAGNVRQKSARHLVFNPSGRLRKDAPYRVRVRAVRDALNNRGSFFGSGFRT